MKSKILSIFLVCVFVSTFSQENTENEAKVRDIVGFFQYLLNTLGAENSSTRDKEVIVKESFRKVFRDEKVQIEDDLEEGRSVITYKDVRAYLLDVDFFYKRASFEFEILSIEQSQSEDGGVYYKVELNRKLTAVNLDNQPISNTKKRYIEINQDAKDGNLKIVSVYTSPFNRTAQLREWWVNLPLSWREVFFARYGVEGDSLSAPQLQTIAQTDSLDLNGNVFITNLDPIYVLTSLRYLDISDTQVESLQPLRSTSKLQSLLARNTAISDLQYIKFNEGLKHLDISNTRVQDILPVGKFYYLKKLNISGLNVSDFNAIRLLKSLEWLDASGTAFKNVTYSGLESLKWLSLANSSIEDIRDLASSPMLTEIDLSYTTISDLRPLKALQNLTIVRINQTQVTSLSPLMDLPNLQKIYAENIPIAEADINQFTTTRPKVLIVRNARQVEDWWLKLSAEYKSTLSALMGSSKPTTEALIRFLSVDSLDLHGAPIKLFEPLKAFKRLTYLNLDNTQIGTLEGISELNQLVYLSASLSKVKTAQVTFPKKLKRVNLSGTQITALADLNTLNNLEYLDIDNTHIPKQEILGYVATHVDCEVIYRTEELTNWWSGLTEEWRRLMGQNQKLSANPDKRELHALTSKKELQFVDEMVYNLDPLAVFSQLRSLTIIRLPIGNLSKIPYLDQLETLVVNEMPVTDISFLAAAGKLKKLSLKGTGISDLKYLVGLNNLEELDISGTQVKKLNGLEDLKTLKRLNCSNTGVFTLSRITELTSLQLLTCFNTKLRDNDLDALRKAVPDCQIVFY